MTFNISIPTKNDTITINISPGDSVIFVGANGTGKTRLATLIENSQELKAHRISAHRALSLNPEVAKISEHKALLGLRTGYDNEESALFFRENNRWGKKGAVALLNDFDYLIQALFAEQSNKSLETHTRVRAGDKSDAEPTKFEILTLIWQKLLPHRKLHISGDDILASVTGSDSQYSASEMSDGERAVFYMLGQALVAAPDSLLIFDEPELHIHPSIMSKLWDEIEAARPDCAFVFITHDLAFSSSRIADKYVLKTYDPAPYWEIEEVPQNSGFSEELTTLILGSRKPILFVEGNDNSFDVAIYRSCFDDWTVIPKGSCSDVIHSVITMKENENFTRVTCCGIIDADGYSQEDKDYFLSLGVYVLPVSEIENLILIPEVSKSIAESEGFSGSALEEKLSQLKDAVFKEIISENDIEKVLVRYCQRRIDHFLKKIDLSKSKNISELRSNYNEKVSPLDIESIAEEQEQKIRKAVETKDLHLLLAVYDNKGMINLAASHLKGCRLATFESWLVRTLKCNTHSDIRKKIMEFLPTLPM